MEEGSSAAALACEEDVGTTAVVAIGSEAAAGMPERIEHRIAELSRSGLSVKEVVYLLASNPADEVRLLRREALRTVVSALKGSDAEIVLVVPHERSATRRSDLFELTETLMVDGGPSLRIRLRFSEHPESDPAASIRRPRRCAERGCGARKAQRPAQPSLGEGTAEACRSKLAREW
jgi:hypothetical protein